MLQQRAVGDHAALRAAVRAQAADVPIHQHHVTVATGRLRAAQGVRSARFHPRGRARHLQAVGLRLRLRRSVALLSLGVGGRLQVLFAAGEAVAAAQLRQAQPARPPARTADPGAAARAAVPAERGGGLPAGGWGG